MVGKWTHPWAVAAACRTPTDSANTCTAWAGSLVRPPRAPLQPAGDEVRPGRPPAWGPRAPPPLPLGLSGAGAEGPSSSSLGAVLEAWPPPVQGAGSLPGRGPGPEARGAGRRSEAGPGPAGPSLCLWPRPTVASPGPGFRGWWMAVCGRAALVSAGLGRLCRLLLKAASVATTRGWAWGPASECTWVAFCCPVTKPTRPAPRPRGHPHGAISLHPALFPACAQACCPGPRESLCLPGACLYLPVAPEQTASPGCLPGGALFPVALGRGC